MGDIAFSRAGYGRYLATQNGELIAWARVNERLNFISALGVKDGYRRKGVATSLVRFIVRDREVRLNRCPSSMKNDAIKALSAKLGDELGPEYVYPDNSAPITNANPS
jgi:hypothetical protein